MATNVDPEKWCKDKVRKMKERWEDTLRHTMLDSFGEMVARCPVKTGRLRHFIYLDTEKHAAHGDIVPEPPGGFGPPPMPKVRWDADEYVIGDPVPYADLIEFFGWSKKAPEGFITPVLYTIKDRLVKAWKERAHLTAGADGSEAPF